MFNTDGAQRLLRIDGQSESVLELEVSCFNADSYDLGWQALTDCMTPPGARFVIVSVQRSSTLILVDYIANEKCGQVELAGRRGNPQLCIRTELDFFCKRL